MFPALLFAQFNNNTSSPYSRYGLGELHHTVLADQLQWVVHQLQAETASRLILAILLRSMPLILWALCLNLQSMESIQNLKMILETNTSSNVNFQYFAMNFQINNRMGTSLGLVPFTDVGYNVVVDEEIENTGPVRTTYYGAGTISNAFLGLLG